MRYSTISGPQMRSIILGVARDDHARARITAILKPVRSRTAKDQLAIRRWTDGEKTAWVEKFFDLLDSVSVGGKRYVDAIFLMFSSTIATKDRILPLFNVDACVGKVLLDSYTLYLVISFTSNFNIVPVAYCWICANESSSSWTRIFKFIKSCLPDFSSSASIASYQDKSIAGAIYTVFSEQITHQMPCVIHRKKNLARHGKKAVDVYDRIVYARTLEGLESIKRSAQFSCLNEGARVAITEHYEDSVQFLSACVSASSVTYGRTSSQAVESHNFHIKDARALDLFNSVLWIAEFGAERYAKWAQKSTATNCHLPPKIRDMLHEAKRKVNIGEVSSVPSQSSDDLRVFIVQTAPRRRHTVSLALKRDQR